MYPSSTYSLFISFALPSFFFFLFRLRTYVYVSGGGCGQEPAIGSYSPLPPFFFLFLMGVTHLITSPLHPSTASEKNKIKINRQGKKIKMEFLLICNARKRKRTFIFPVILALFFFSLCVSMYSSSTSFVISPAPFSKPEAQLTSSSRLLLMHVGSRGQQESHTQVDLAI